MRSKLFVAFVLVALTVPVAVRADQYALFGKGVDRQIAIVNATYATNTTTVVTNQIDIGTTHTIQAFVTATGTNTSTVAYAGGIDGTNFVTIGTLTTTSNTAAQAVFEGQYRYLRTTVTFTGSNGVALVNLIGGQ